MGILRGMVLMGAAALMSGMAHAADVEPVPVAYDWSGFYVGLHAGYLWGDVDVEEEGETSTTGGEIDGFVGGALAGFNAQFDSLVLGVEGDIGWTDADGDGSDADPEYDYHYDLSWIAHVRGRAGFAFDNVLIFLAGGLAIADLDVDQELTRIGGTYYGWTIGGGVDFAFSDSLIGRLEYLHDDFGKEHYTVEQED